MFPKPTSTQYAPILPRLGRGSRGGDADSPPTARRDLPARRNSSPSPDGPPKAEPQAPIADNSAFGGALTQVKQPSKRDLPPLDTKVPASQTPLLNRAATIQAHKLQQWQKQPKNLSPAAHLVLPAMIGPPPAHMKNRPLLLLDVDETLVHASFTPAKPYNLKVTIEIDGEKGDIYVAYRPHVHTFLRAIAPLFEVAIFTASLSCYANQVMDVLDPDRTIVQHRLFREHCTEVNGARVKDMCLLGRSLDRLALVDNSPVTYLFQPRNAIPIASWFDDPNDTELLKLLPMLRQLADAASVYDVLDSFNCTRT